MNIAIFGLGYVGCVSLGCLAQNGHNLIGVDINKTKVNLINKGKPTIIEKDIDKIIQKQHKNGKIRATTSYADAVKNSEIAFICVGTPSLETGQLNLKYVYNTAKQIGETLKSLNVFYVIVIRSTVFPGTNKKVADIIESNSGKKKNTDFAVVSNPEFLREGSAVEDYYNPSLTVVGSDNTKAIKMLKEIYKTINAPFVDTDIKAAEMIKYINNTFHALKISFANEVGNICKEIGVDSFKVMELFKMDKRLNISTAYFNPGMAYGGSCLPKDLKGFYTIAHDHYVKAPVINAIEKSNELQKERVVNIINKYHLKNIGVYGLAFKKGTDDLRHSPSVNLIESLIGKGYNVKIYDKYVNVSRLTGTNKSYIEEHLPHFSKLLYDDLNTLLADSEIIVLAHKPGEEKDIKRILDFKGIIIDLINLNEAKKNNKNYEGLSW